MSLAVTLKARTPRETIDAILYEIDRRLLRLEQSKESAANVRRDEQLTARIAELTALREFLNRAEIHR